MHGSFGESWTKPLGPGSMHVHTRIANAFAKFRVEPVDLDYAQGMNYIVAELIFTASKAWYEYGRFVFC